MISWRLRKLCPPSALADQAILHGHNFFSFSVVGGTGPLPALCATHAECKNPESGAPAREVGRVAEVADEHPAAAFTCTFVSDTSS